MTDSETKPVRFWVYEVDTIRYTTPNFPDPEDNVDYNRSEKPIGEVTIMHPSDGDGGVYVVEDNPILFAAVDTWIEKGKRLVSVEMYRGKEFGYYLFDTDENMLFQLIEIDEKEDTTNGE